jgi:RNA polymerase sigma-70 factor (ECF subfamily)
VDAQKRAVLEATIQNLLERGEFSAAATNALRGYGPEILGYLIVVLHDVDAADEAFAQFSEDLWTGMRHYRRACSMRTWVYKLAWEAAKPIFRDPYRRRKIPMDDGEWSKIEAEVRRNTAPYLKTTVKGRLTRIRERLDPGDQTLLTLRIDQKLSWRDVATVFSCDGESVDVPALRKRYERLKDRLRKMAEEEGLLETGE